MSIRLGTLTAIASLIGFSGFQANSMELGEFEFQNSCVQCHGTDAKGGGWMTEYLTIAAPDLTLLAKNNDGVFPVKRVYEIIDGSAELGAHGREMPVWGVRYMVDAFQAKGDPSADFPFDPMVDYEKYVRMRILSLIDYLATIQE